MVNFNLLETGGRDAINHSTVQAFKWFEKLFYLEWFEV